MKLLRIAVSLQALAVLAQAIFAGQFLSGADGSVKLHEYTAYVAVFACLLQIAAAVKAALPRTVFLPFLLSSILIALAEGLQIGTGYTRVLPVHIPLGVLIFGAAVAQFVWVLRAE